jgi:hypothetical protein
MVANDPIVINQASLQQLQKTYAGYVDGIDANMGKYVQYGTLSLSNVDITMPLKMNLGGAGFDEVADMSGQLEKVRAGLVGRFTSAKNQLRTMEYGIQFLLADSDSTEHLATLTAEDWNYWMSPTTGT